MKAEKGEAFQVAKTCLLGLKDKNFKGRESTVKVRLNDDVQMLGFNSVNCSFSLIVMSFILGLTVGLTPAFPAERQNRPEDESLTAQYYRTNDPTDRHSIVEQVLTLDYSTLALSNQWVGPHFLDLKHFHVYEDAAQPRHPIDIRKLGVEGLTIITNRQALVALSRLLSDTDPSIQGQVLTALKAALPGFHTRPSARRSLRVQAGRVDWQTPNIVPREVFQFMLEALDQENITISKEIIALFQDPRVIDSLLTTYGGPKLNQEEAISFFAQLATHRDLAFEKTLERLYHLHIQRTQSSNFRATLPDVEYALITYTRVPSEPQWQAYVESVFRGPEAGRAIHALQLGGYWSLAYFNKLLGVYHSFSTFPPVPEAKDALASRQAQVGLSSFRQDLLGVLKDYEERSADSAQRPAPASIIGALELLMHRHFFDESILVFILSRSQRYRSLYEQADIENQQSMIDHFDNSLKAAMARLQMSPHQLAKLVGPLFSSQQAQSDSWEKLLNRDVLSLVQERGRSAFIEQQRQSASDRTPVKCQGILKKP